MREIRLDDGGGIIAEVMREIKLDVGGGIIAENLRAFLTVVYSLTAAAAVDDHCHRLGNVRATCVDAEAYESIRLAANNQQNKEICNVEAIAKETGHLHDISARRNLSAMSSTTGSSVC